MNTPLLPPAELKTLFPCTPNIQQFVGTSQETIRAIMEGKDSRLLVVIGPCSIHDPKGALEYALRLKNLAERLKDQLFIVMRVYFQKPRTTVGWKGFLYDPDLAGHVDIQKGLKLGRQLMREINQLGVPVATEFLDPITPQYLSDLVSWAAVGARTSESQLHRELASFLPMPVGFKNGTTGNTQVAIDGVHSAAYPHEFLSINEAGLGCAVEATGNPYAHVVLRGSQDAPNYEKKYVEETVQKLRALGRIPRLMIDCSHGNSQKQHRNQLGVMEDLVTRLPQEPGIFGVMIESYLKPGKQTLSAEPLEYGVSITDACIGWEETVRALEILNQSLGAQIQKGLTDRPLF